MAATGTNTNTSAGADNLTDRLRFALTRLSNQQKILLLVSLAAIVALVVATSTWLKHADYRILFSNISERDGGAIIAALDQMNVPYKFSDSGGAVLIPGGKVHEVRLRLASQGLPKSGGVGFELMENQKFGISQFAEQVNYQRGLEGELSRTIQSIGAVQSARVHLAIPKPSVFVREELKPSASVLLNLYPGRMLEPSQIAGIQNLVAASVPNLAFSAVTLIDQSGAMLSQVRSGNRGERHQARRRHPFAYRRTGKCTCSDRRGCRFLSERANGRNPPPEHHSARRQHSKPANQRIGEGHTVGARHTGGLEQPAACSRNCPADATGRTRRRTNSPCRQTLTGSA